MASRDELLAAVHQQYVAASETESAAPTKKDCERMLKAVLNAIGELAMQKDGSVRTSIGTFKRAEKAERNARNPKTDEPVKVAARAKLSFKPSVGYVFIEGVKPTK